MTATATIRLLTGNAIPPGNEEKSRAIIEFWQQVDGFFRHKPFLTCSSAGSEVLPWSVTLEVAPLLHTLKNAHSQSGSFNRHRQGYIETAKQNVEGELVISIASDQQELDETASYQLATNFIQQLVMAAHIACPGALQILQGRFVGAGAHRYEPQQFDARLFYGAERTARDHQWPPLVQLDFEQVWRWLEASEVSQTDTAIKGINKVLFTLLKVAEQRHEYSARTVLLILYQLEILLDCRQFNSLPLLYDRLRLVLGDIPEAANCLKQLHEIRHLLFTGSQPVHPPPLICHTTDSTLQEQLGQHNSVVESGTALVLALLQDLVTHNAHHYRFSEDFSRGN